MQVETLSREDLASRLTLTADAASVGPLLLPDSSITLMDTNDYCATPQSLKDQVCERYPGARRAYLKSGGDFPFLSRPDEVNLHLQLHLRRVGVEARPDLIPGAPKDGSGGSSNEPNNGRKDADDSSENDKRDSETPPPAESAEPPLAPEATGSHDLDNQLLKMAKLSDDTGESVSPPLENSFFHDKQNLLVSRALLNVTCEFFILNMLPLYLGNCTLTGNVAAM
uniref:Maspardin n=1 Tax=Solanum tuberosum TaxID=4113 RepID=M0ZXH6_SOLTU